MKAYIKTIFERFLGSFDNVKNQGFSGRKLTAFVLIMVIVAIHIKWMIIGDLKALENVLIIDYSFISALFGMTTLQSMKEKKDDAANETK